MKNLKKLHIEHNRYTDFYNVSLQKEKDNGSKVDETYDFDNHYDVLEWLEKENIEGVYYDSANYRFIVPETLAY